MKSKCIAISWLCKTDLSNINAGDGGAGNIVELKTYRNGKRPYASGQSVRHALREAIERGNPNCFTSTPEAPSCDIKNDWLCDLFGYLSPKSGLGSDRRWSPIKCSPALGQIDCEIVTDMLTRHSDLEKKDSEKKDNRIAYTQLAENIFKTGMVIDVFNVGRERVVEGNEKKKEITKLDYKDCITEEERIKRVKAVINSLAQMGDFAKQARNAISFTPDIFILSKTPVYTQRIFRSMDLDNNKRLDIETLDVIIKDIKELNGTIYVGYTPNVISNDKEFLDLCKNYDIEVGNPISILKKAAEEVD